MSIHLSCPVGFKYPASPHARGYVNHVIGYLGQYAQQALVLGNAYNAHYHVLSEVVEYA